MKNRTDKVVYVAKATFKFGKLGLDIVQRYFQDVIIIPYDGHVQSDTELNHIRDSLKEIEYDYLISFWSELLIKENELQKAKKGAINIHPAPPEHPGLGMFSFLRLFPEKRSHHGATLHEMDKFLDHGKIYRTIRFPINQLSDLELIDHTGKLTLDLLEYACKKISTGENTSILQDDQAPQEKWSKEFYTAALEQEWLDALPPDHAIQRLSCTDVDHAILYVEFGAAADSIQGSI